MATPTTISGHVESGLESLQLMLADMADIAKEWAQISDGERASWSLDWDQLMATDMRVLERQYRSGAMTLDQQARYRDLLCRLKAVVPIMVRLGLSPPPVPLEA